jgi:hypothetical protein
MKNVLNDDGDKLLLLDPQDNFVASCEKLDGQEAVISLHVQEMKAKSAKLAEPVAAVVTADNMDIETVPKDGAKGGGGKKSVSSKGHPVGKHPTQNHGHPFIG